MARPRGFADQVTDRRLPPSSLVLDRDRPCSSSVVIERLQDKNPVSHTNAKECWQRVEKRIEALIGMKIAADETSFLTASAVFEDVDMVPYGLRIDVLDRHGQQPGVACHDVLIAARKNDHVTCFDHCRWKLAAR